MPFRQLLFVNPGLLHQSARFCDLLWPSYYHDLEHFASRLARKRHLALLLLHHHDEDSFSSCLWIRGQLVWSASEPAFVRSTHHRICCFKLLGLSTFLVEGWQGVQATHDREGKPNTCLCLSK